jgi:hypothetical protein
MQVGYTVVVSGAQRVPPPPTSLGPRQNPPPVAPSRADWSPWENALLLQAVARFGASDWNRVTRAIGGRHTKAQCAQHWFRCLNPAIAKGRWTKHADEKLSALIRRFGPRNWVKIAKEMGSRSDVQCRHRYIQIKRNQVEPPTHRALLPSIDTLLDGQPREPLPTEPS